MELKLETLNDATSQLHSSNRTFMELKSKNI